MKRFFDMSASLVLLLVLIFPLIIIAIVVKISSKGAILFWSDRIGRNNVVFNMPKFRTMKTSTPNKATHLLEEPGSFITPFGQFLRRFSMDELPQLFSIIKGDMSFVGPRPALFNQEDLIKMRKIEKIDVLIPGLTGWAQVNGRDGLSIHEKVCLDKEYMENQSFWFDLKIICNTLIKTIKNQDVSH
tara:strand:+ start:554 stop:1114 length:561 start_codon:yes stop_codon:yes gene_type:complete